MLIVRQTESSPSLLLPLSIEVLSAVVFSSSGLLVKYLKVASNVVKYSSHFGLLQPGREECTNLEEVGAKYQLSKSGQIPSAITVNFVFLASSENCCLSAQPKTIIFERIPKV